MKTRPTEVCLADDRASERGLTLPEALIAITVFAIVFISALTLYSVASSTYLRTDSAVIQQQNIRFTMDKMSETLRDAGAGHNMLGSRKVADEQIEGMWESAVFVRGDFDGERESSLATKGLTTDLENATFPLVTTGNDEIVGFVLLKNGVGTIPITLHLDLTGTGRDALYTNDTTISGEETATVNVAATTLAEQTDPPYQLARVTFAANGDPKYEIIAENIAKLSFTYGTLTAAVTPTGGDDGTPRADRASVRRIGVRLVGMSDRADLTLNKNAGAGAGVRTFPLEQTILPGNLGIIGSPHEYQPAMVLPVPASITDCTGHCRQHLIRWEAAVAVNTYQLEISAPAMGGLEAFSEEYGPIAALQYEFQEPTNDKDAEIFRPWTFRVAATSGAMIGTYTTGVTKQQDNPVESTPVAPTTVAATGAGTENAMSVTWGAVTTNVSAVTSTTLCLSNTGVSSAPPAPWNIQAKDLTDSKVFRVRSDGTNNGSAASTDISEQTIGSLKNAVSNTAFLDRTAAPCTPYFYRVKACDLCTRESAFSTAMANPASYQVATGVVPDKPPAAPTPVGGVIGNNGTNYSVQLQWNSVIQTSTGAPAAVAHYVLERWSRVGTAAFAKEAEFDVYENVINGSVVGPVTPDTPPINDANNNKIDYRYYAKAVYDCSPVREGALSDPYDLTCAPGTNTLVITQPVYADVVTRPAETALPIQLTVGGTGWTEATVQIFNAAGTMVYTDTIAGGPSSGLYTFTSWPVISVSIPDGYYTIAASGLVGSCRAFAPAQPFQIETVSCGQRIVSAVFKGSGGNTATSMEFKIENSCAATTINQFTSIWTGVVSTLRIRNLSSSATTYYSNSTGVASNQAMPFQANLVLAAGTVAAPSTSPLLTFTFSDNFTADGTKFTTTGGFTSVLARVTSPLSVNEQLVDGVTRIP